MVKPTFGWFVQLSDRDNAFGIDLLDANRRFIQRLGHQFTTLWFCDHLQYEKYQVFESWSALTYYAAKFPQLNIGTLVLSQSFRNPALLAKMAATVQHLCNGRLILGVGAGWKEDEYVSYDYAFTDFQIRAEQLREAVQIIRLLWAKSPASYKGKHYSITGACCEPRPDPAPPLLIGGGGEKYILPIVAEHADWMNFYFTDLETYIQKLEVLRSYCLGVERDPDSIVKTLHCYVLLSEDEDLPSSKGDRHIISGRPIDVAREFSRFIEVGVEHFMIRFLDFPNHQSLDLFRESVIPKL